MMEIFNLIAGMASILSLVISVVSLVKVSEVQKLIKANQDIHGNKVSDNSHITQVAGDYKAGRER